MAKEILAIPEELLEEFCKFLRCALGTLERPDTEKADRLVNLLDRWLDSEEDYLRRMKDE